jgi:hypothetical protein
MQRTASAHDGSHSAADRVRATVAKYAEPLLRQVAQRLLRPRSQWPAEELIERCVAALANAVVIDRRLNDLSPAARKLLAVVGLSRQPVWRVGHLLAMLATLDHAEGFAPIQELLEGGLAYPVLSPGIKSLKQFEDWLGESGLSAAALLIPTSVTIRLVDEELGLPALPARKIEGKPIHSGDGLEWLLRTAVAWQRIAVEPLRLTQQRSLFKRDTQTFQTDPLLATPFVEHHVDLPDIGLLTLELAIAIGLIERTPQALNSRPAPALWNESLTAALDDVWANLWLIESWDPALGYLLADENSVWPSVALPAFLLLRLGPPGQWLQASSIAAFLFARHPAWAAMLKKNEGTAVRWIEALFLGFGCPLRLVEAVRDNDEWWFRLGDIGQHVLAGQQLPKAEHAVQQTLVVQPNGEMVIFRQGLTPALLGKLTRCALWKTIGAACTMELTPESVYRGLETGLTQTELERLLEQHGTRSVPATVLDSLQRWSSKRERITVYSSATLLEFAAAEDLEVALARGLVAVKLTDRIGLSPNGEEIDYRHFRLTGNRDYGANPQTCVTFDADGVTFTVDGAQSDLILEAELGRLADPVAGSSAIPRRYVLTPASLKRSQEQAITITELERWAEQRTGAPLSSAARLLFAGSGGRPAFSQHRLVVQLPSEAVADGVLQWPPTAALVAERLGPCSIAVAQANLPALTELLANVGIEIKPV